MVELDGEDVETVVGVKGVEVIKFDVGGRRKGVEVDRWWWSQQLLEW